MLHERARSLADFDPGLAEARRLERLDEGSPSPPQHRGLVHEYAALGREVYQEYKHYDSLHIDNDAQHAIISAHHLDGFREIPAALVPSAHYLGLSPPSSSIGKTPLVAAITDETWRSVNALRKSPDWSIAGGWKEVALKEIEQVIHTRKP